MLPAKFVSVFDALEGGPPTFGPSTFDTDIEARLFQKKMKREVEKALGVYGLMGRQLLTIDGVIYSVPSPDWAHDDRDILTGYTNGTSIR